MTAIAPESARRHPDARFDFRVVRRSVSLLACAALLLACSGRGTKKQGNPGTCKRFGEQCQVAPGKLGSCVVRDNCVGSDCLVCQAQH